MSNTIHNIYLVTDKSKPGYTLQSQVRADQAKERATLDEIHILLEHEGYSNKEIVEYLIQYGDCENKREARQYLRRFKENQMAESEKNYKAEQARLSSEIAEIREMENRNG